jgi:hypothetical protein
MEDDVRPLGRDPVLEQRAPTLDVRAARITVVRVERDRLDARTVSPPRRA